MRQGRRTDFVIISVITAIFLLVIIMNDRLIFKITSNQTEEIGQTQLELIRGDFQSTLTKAEGATTQVAIEAEQMINAGTTREDLEKFFYDKKREQKNLTGGVCFNVYIYVADKDWTIIPDFAMPPAYHASERLWCKGATENPGKIYITEPYVDAMTGAMCFTMSKLLEDGQTVVALDFNFSDVQKSILQMSTTIDRKALIVTKSGMIIGYTDMNLVGEKISRKLPEYDSILSRVIRSERHDSFIAQLEDGEHTIFSS